MQLKGCGYLICRGINGSLLPVVDGQPEKDFCEDTPHRPNVGGSRLEVPEGEHLNIVNRSEEAHVVTKLGMISGLDTTEQQRIQSRDSDWNLPWS